MLSSPKKHDVDNVIQMITMLNKGRGDVFAGYRLVHGYQIEQLGKENQLFPSKSFGASDEFVLTKKGSEKGNEMLKVFGAGKLKIKENGKLAAIEKKWME